jgi:energy-coupling factor transporter ATP-binding protein EcfA2
LVGANGVGKSSVIEALADFTRDQEGSCRRVSLDTSAIVRRGASSAKITLEDETRRYAIERDNQGGRKASVDKPPVEYAALVGIELGLSPRRIAEPSEVSKVRPDFDGFGTASTLAQLKINESVRYQRVLERTQRVVDHVVDFGFDVVSVQVVASSIRGNAMGGRTYETRAVHGYALHVSFDRAPKIPAPAVSEGTLLTIATWTAIEVYTDARLLLIDDLDRALHVQAQARFVEVLREVQREVPTLQIVATTHSPVVVDLFRDDEVVVLGKKDGCVAAKRLSEHPKRTKIRSLSTGEFWLAELEQWV